MALSVHCTGSGITDVAGAIVKVMEDLFPMYIDELPRERAFFDGNKPYLFQGTDEEQILPFLTGLNPNSAKVLDLCFGSSLQINALMPSHHRLPSCPIQCLKY